MAARDFAHLQADNAEVERSVLSQEVEVLRNRLGLRQVDVSKECGVNASMLSQWMLGRYKGNVGRINGLMESWLIRRRGGKPVDRSVFVTSNATSPKLKRKLDDANDPNNPSKRASAALRVQRRLYKYPKFPSTKTTLIPIRIDVDVEGYRYIDSFTWNIYEQDFTAETFAATLVHDLDLPEVFHKPITASIEAQVAKAHQTQPWHNAVTTESLHPIFINLRINDTIFIDRFEWDLNDSNNSPEEFARVLCEDMGLSGEFEAQIALSIREQLQEYARLMREGLRDRVTRLPPVTVPFRDRADIDAWSPSVKYVLAEDVPQLEREDYKRMRPHSQSTMIKIPPVPIPKPNRPPKPVNTFLMFCRQWRKKIMVDHPNTNAKDASKILGDMWQKLTEEQRASYIPITEHENQRRLNEWRMKENLPLTMPLTSASTATNASNPSAPMASIPQSPSAFAASQSTTPRLAPMVPSIDGDDDEDEDGDEDDDADDDDPDDDGDLDG